MAGSVDFDVFARDKASRVFDRVGQSAGKLEGKFSKLGNGLAAVGKIGAVGLAALGAAAVVGGKQMFDLGAKLQQMGDKAATVFGDQLGSVDKWAAKNAAAMGLTKRATVGLAANFGDLLIPMGFTRKEAAKMSTSVVGLSGALSQWSGGTIDAAGASDILAKAMLGERDGLKALGISISDADVKARLLKDGNDKLTGSALEQAKAQATQALIFEKSTDAQKKFAEGGSPLLAAQAKLKATFGEMKDSLAVGLTPAFTTAATWLGEKLPVAVDRVSKFMNDKGVPALKSFAGYVRDEVIPRMRDFGDFIRDEVLPRLKRFAGYVRDDLAPALSNFAQTVLPAVVSFLGTLRDAVSDMAGAFKRDGVSSTQSFGDSLTTLVNVAGPVLIAWLKVAETNIKVLSTAFVVATFPIRKMADAVLDLSLVFLGALSTMARKAADVFDVLGMDGLADKLRGVAGEIEIFAERSRRAINGIPDLNVTARITGGQAAIDELAALRWEINRLPRSVTVGVVNKVTRIPPGFADGVRNFAGGLAVVGERGPELVSLPRGADVFSNPESVRMARAGTVAGSSSGTTIINLSVSAIDGPGAAAAVKNALDEYVRRNGPLRGLTAV